MNIIIVGGGRVGENLCIDLTSNGHDITLVEKDSDILESLINNIDITGVVGNGATFDTLHEAGVEDADVFIAVTNSDELNIISSIIAHKMGAKHTIARVRDPEYSQNMEFVRKDLGIDLMINPEKEAAKKISQIISYPSAYNVESFMGGKVNIVKFILDEDNLLVGKALKDIKTNNVLICMVERGDEVYVPDGNFQLEKDDEIYVTGEAENINKFSAKCGIKNYSINSVLIIGAGQLSYYLVSMLYDKDINIKVIDDDYEKTREIAENFPRVQVIYGDGTDHDFLKQEGMRYFDAFVAETDIDEENIVLSLLAKNLEIPKIICKIDQDNLETIAANLDIISVINPKNIIADTILKAVKSYSVFDTSRLQNFHRMSQERVFRIQFYIKEENKLSNIPLKDLELKRDTLIACIRRNGQIIYPGGNDFISPGDEVLLITKNKNIEHIDQLVGEASEQADD